MAFNHGKDSYFQVGSHNLTTYLDNIDIVGTADTAETSTMGNTAKTYIPGLADSTISLSGKWDDTTTANEVQTISQTGTVTAGTWTISFDGQTTTSINWNDNLATIQARLDAKWGSSQIVASGGSLPGTPVVLTFSGSNYAGSNQPLAVANSGSLTGGTYGIVETTPGSGGPDKVLQADVGTTTTFVYCPAGRGTGVGSGKVQYTGTGILTNYKVTSPIGGVVAWTADFQVTPGSLTRSLL